MASKIKNIIESTPAGGVLTSSWLSQKGVSRTEQVSYVKSGWLERLYRGVYQIKGAKLKLYPSLNALNMQSGFSYHIGAITALEMKGYSHYGQFSKLKVFLYSDKKLPEWILRSEWDMNIIPLTADKYGDIGLTEMDYEGVTVKISTPERAFFESLDLIPVYANPMDLYYIMEMLTTLRPGVIMRLLQKATVKTRRLFLYMADKARHQWFDELDISKIPLGSGDRSISPGGVYDSKYKIVIPKELNDYE